MLKEDQLADLFIWTALRYPQSDDPKHEGSYSITLRDEIADLRNAIPQHLASLGTPDCIKQLARARRTVPEGDWLKYYEVDARANAHRSAWTPAKPPDILRFSSPEDSLLVPNIGFAIALLLALAPPFLDRFTLFEKLGLEVTIALGALLLFQMPLRRRSTWFPLVVIAFSSALVIEVARLVFQAGK